MPRFQPASRPLLPTGDEAAGLTCTASFPTLRAGPGSQHATLIAAHLADEAACVQAMMELGATVCMPAKTTCPACPLKHMCQAYARQREHLAAGGSEKDAPSVLAYPRKARLHRSWQGCGARKGVFDGSCHAGQCMEYREYMTKLAGLIASQAQAAYRGTLPLLQPGLAVTLLMCMLSGKVVM